MQHLFRRQKIPAVAPTQSGTSSYRILYHLVLQGQQFFPKTYIHEIYLHNTELGVDHLLGLQVLELVDTQELDDKLGLVDDELGLDILGLVADDILELDDDELGLVAGKLERVVGHDHDLLHLEHCFLLEF